MTKTERLKSSVAKLKVCTLDHDFNLTLFNAKVESFQVVRIALT